MNLIRPTLLSTLALAALSLAPSAARAADAVKLEEHESHGYFDKIGRVGLFYGMQSGDRPAGGDAGVSGPTAPSESYKRNGFGLDFDLLGFWDATRFDTLLGAELVTKFGSYSSEKVDGGQNQDKSYLMFRMDAAADYGLLHWDGPMKGRISGGAGFGFDLDGGKWYAEKGRLYALLLARVQLQVGGIGLHGAYHWVPTTTNDGYVREHRFEGAAGIGPLHAGLRFIVTTARPASYTADDPFMASEGQLFVAYAF